MTKAASAGKELAEVPPASNVFNGSAHAGFEPLNIIERMAYANKVGLSQSVPQRSQEYAGECIYGCLGSDHKKSSPPS